MDPKGTLTKRVLENKAQANKREEGRGAGKGRQANLLKVRLRIQVRTMHLLSL